MRKHASTIATGALVLAVIVVFANRPTPVQGQARQEVRVAAVPGEKGGQDMFGAYDIVPNWPKPISSLPGHEKWTWGAGQSVFAESPNRVFILQRGELPNIPRPMTIKLPQLGPNIEFPNFRLPWRDATVASPRGGSRHRTGKSATTPTSARPASTTAGNTASSSWTPTATSSRTGRSGTRCCGGRTPSTSARTIRRSASGSSMTTGTPFSFSATTGSGCCRRSASPTCTRPTTSTSTGRRSWPGCPTARSSSRTGTPTRAS